MNASTTKAEPHEPRLRLARNQSLTGLYPRRMISTAATTSGQTAIRVLNGTRIVGGGAANANAGPSLKAIGAV